jgi:hypothetical protein
MYGGKPEKPESFGMTSHGMHNGIASTRSPSLRKTARITGHWKIKSGGSNMDVIIFFVVSMGMASVPISLDYVLQLMWQKNNRTKKSS